MVQRNTYILTCTGNMGKVSPRDISMKKIALRKVLGLKTFAKMYLGPCQTSMMKPCCENS